MVSTAVQAGVSFKRRFLPPLAGAAVCVLMARGGFLYFLFLAPLGFLSYRFGSVAAWYGFAFASGINLLVSLALGAGAAGWELFWDLFYFTGMAGLFTWVAAPLPPGKGLPSLSGPARMAWASALGAALFAMIFQRTLGDPVFYGAVKSQVEALAGADMAAISPDMVLEVMKAVLLRGGALVTAALLFWASRQLGLFLSRLTGGAYRARSLRFFHVPGRVIWALSFSLFLVFLSTVLRIGVIEILSWNALTLCVMLYLAQGLGIAQHFLMIRSDGQPMPLTARLMVGFGFVAILLSPVLNVILAVLVTALGITENWLPIRAARDRPPPTPEA